MHGIGTEHLRRYWRRSIRRIGIAGWIGLALMGLAGAGVAASKALNRRAEDSERLLAQRQAGLAKKPAIAQAPVDVETRTARLVDTFPPFSQSADDLRLIFATAKRFNLELAKGDYALQSDTASPLLGYVINLPVHEPYPAVKHFAAAVLDALPHAALDEIRVSRPDAGGMVPDTTLRFTVVYRPSSATPAAR